jgi:ATP-dependent Clp protease ATP-binding subunit ClpA
MVTRNEAIKVITKSINEAMSDCPTLAKVGRVLTLQYLEDKLDPCYNREEIITSIQKIMLRKNKANALLTGAAGCGKTAIAEGTAAVYAERFIASMQKYMEAKRAYKQEYTEWEKNDEFTATPDMPQEADYFGVNDKTIIIEVTFSALVGGTKYRGDLEERIEELLQECRRHPGFILFIDEAHQLANSGKCEGGEGVSQLMKPALARGDIRVIGATTTEEANYLWADKALARRFNEVKVPQLATRAAVQTAEGIMADYCKYHKVHSNMLAEDLLCKVFETLPHTVFPDNFINVVDETLAGCRFDGVQNATADNFLATLARMSA